MGNTKLDHKALPKTCSACGRVGHRSACCTLNPAPHLKIGIEIEGGWEDINAARDEAARVAGKRGTSDGSVTVGDDFDCVGWEFQTEPDSLGGALRQLTKLYPDYVNGSCGMHVHVSFANHHDIGLLDTRDFYQYFRDKWTDWGNENAVHRDSPFWSRLRGENNYCRVNRDPQGIEMGRYYQLNFSSWSEHRTVECRLLPMFKQSSLAVSAVQWLIHIYDSWINGRGAHLYDLACTVVRPEVVDLSRVWDYSFTTPEVAAVEIPGEVEVWDVPAAPAPGHVRMNRTALINRLYEIGVL